MRMKVLTIVLMALFPMGALAMGFGGDEVAKENPAVVNANSKAMDGDYKGAIGILKNVLANDPENAEAWNILGFSYRNTGAMDDAWDAYERALAIDPNHQGAHEYLGEWYLIQGDVASARAQLAKLEALCPDGCMAQEKLAKSIAAATQGS